MDKERASPRVFTMLDGNREVEFEWSGLHCAHRVPQQLNGWRERPDGTREEVTFYREHGWLTAEEASRRS